MLPVTQIFLSVLMLIAVLTVVVPILKKLKSGDMEKVKNSELENESDERTIFVGADVPNSFAWGTHVICRGNNYKEELQQALVVGYALVSQAKRIHPLVKNFLFDDDGTHIGISDKIEIGMSIIFPYSDIMWNHMIKMTPKEQYDFLRNLKRSDETKEAMS